MSTAQSENYRRRKASKDPEWEARRKAAKQRAYEKLMEDPERKMRLSIRTSARKLGFDPDEIEAKFIENGNKCEACGEACKTNTRVALDHNHDTGEFRGFLCGECNLALGKLGESADKIRALLAYVCR